MAMPTFVDLSENFRVLPCMGSYMGIDCYLYFNAMCLRLSSMVHRICLSE